MYAQLERHLHFQHAALAVLGQRQQLLAANIANADTPHYHARDLDFRAALTAVKAATAGGALHTTHPRHQPLATPPAAALTPGYRLPSQAAVDGNSVDMDAERTAFAENTLRYEASLRFMQSMVSGLHKAIAGQ